MTNICKKAIAALCLAAMPLGLQDVSACTNLIVGKKASVDGSVICTYNCDGFGFAGSMYSTPGGFHEKREMVAIRTWGSGPIRGYIPQVERTYNVIGYINEKQVSIVETTFDGRLELQDPDGLIDYDTMIHLGLQRAASAREAIKIMTDLLQEYGYSETGETITVADKNEAWMLELIGKGPGRKGAVWVAVKVPDDCIAAHANVSRIRQFPQAKKIDKKLGFFNVEGECMYSADCISFAKEMGFYSGPDADFSFRDAYCPINFSNVRYADARVWSFFRHHTDKDVMDSYLPYINGEFDKCDHLPLWIKPDQPLSVRDIMEDMRDHYEGTALDMTADMSAGPWSSPYRPMPMNWEYEGRKYFRERAIGTQQSGFTLVSQLRSWLPDDEGGIMYFNCDDASMVAYVPVFCCMTDVPEAFKSKNNPSNEYNENGAFWRCNLVANMVYPRYSALHPDLREAQVELEDHYADQIASLDLGDLTTAERKASLTAMSHAYTEKMMDRWDTLFRLIVVKHNDLILKPSQNSKITGRYTTPGYDRSFYEQISKDTGERYISPEQSKDIKSL